MPIAGVYVKTPFKPLGVTTVALSCLALRLSAVVMLAGVAQVMVGVAFAITTGGTQLIGVEG